jgi:hypothetical protein
MNCSTATCTSTASKIMVINGTRLPLCTRCADRPRCLGCGQIMTYGDIHGDQCHTGCLPQLPPVPGRRQCAGCGRPVPSGYIRCNRCIPWMWTPSSR